MAGTCLHKIVVKINKKHLSSQYFLHLHFGVWHQVSKEPSFVEKGISGQIFMKILACLNHITTKDNYLNHAK